MNPASTDQPTGRHRENRHWALFVDWCTAVGRAALPATAETVLAFVAELPAGPATTRRRIAAIDLAHLAAGYRPPSAEPAFDGLLRPDRPPRYQPALVACALQLAPIGGWPTGITARRDSALVALVCSAGLTRRHVQALRCGPALDDDHAPAISAMATTERPGTCPACAVSRWLRVQAMIATAGWRAVRNGLADLGETPAAFETTHDCTRIVTWPQPPAERGAPLFTAIDRHGSPEPNYPLTTRSITTIIATRLSAAEASLSTPSDTGTAPDPATGAPGGAWGQADRTRVWDQRKQSLERLAAFDSLLDEADAYAEAILQRLDTGSR
jgi:hypothetical protein